MSRRTAGLLIVMNDDRTVLMKIYVNAGENYGIFSAALRQLKRRPEVEEVWELTDKLQVSYRRQVFIVDDTAVHFWNDGGAQRAIHNEQESGNPYTPYGAIFADPKNVINPQYDWGDNRYTAVIAA